MRKNEVVLSKKEIADGIDKIQHELLLVGLRCEEGDIGYETLYTDHLGETQGGWYAEFDKKSRDKLREARQVSWRNIGMISGDSLDSILRTVASLKFRNCVAPTKVKKAIAMINKESATKAAVNKFHSTAALTDEELNLCIKHYQTLEQAIHADQTLQLAWAYVSQCLNTLVQFKEARKSK